MRAFPVFAVLFLAASQAHAVARLDCAPLDPKTPDAAAVAWVDRSVTSDSENEAKRQHLGPTVVRLGDSIDVFVCNLETLYKAVGEKQKNEAVLFINGVDADVEPEMKDLQRGALRFHLERNSKNDAIWAALFRDPFSRKTPPLSISVGVPGEKPLPVTPSAQRLELRRIRITWVSRVSIGLVIATLLALFYLATTSDMLRNGPQPTGAKKQPYSLARTQMAWWFILILAGYVLIWQISGAADPIPVSLLALMGISGATALAAVAIDGTSASRVNATRARLTAEKLALETSTADIDTQVTNATNAINAGAVGAALEQLQRRRSDLTEVLDNKNATLETVNKKLLRLGATPETDHFFTDILTDDDGVIALHRLQIVVWTIVLGLWFISSVIYDLSMPEFDPTLLALMGISSGTYLGFKFPEKS